MPVKAKIVWASDHSIELNEYEFGYDEGELYSSPTFRNINKKIKNFCSRTEKFGKKHFGNKEWLWFEILWEYCPEQGESYRGLRIDWTDDYEYWLWLI